MADLRTPRPTGYANPVRPGLVRPVQPAQPTGPRPRPARPNANPLRLMLGLVGIASASALTAAMLPSIAPYGTTATVAAGEPATAVGPAPSVVHVTRVVQLAPGQTAPPNASVQVKPQPTPRVKVKVVTQQSGKP